MVAVDLKIIKYNLYFRSRKLISVIILTGLVLFTFSSVAYNLKQKPIQIAPLNVDNERRKIINPVYKKWIKSFGESFDSNLEKKCSLYFHELSTQFPHNRPSKIIDPESDNDFKFDSGIYKKKKWLKSRTVEYKRMKDKKRTAEEIEELVNKEYYRKFMDLINYEKLITENINHQRIWGKCFLENGTSIGDDYCHTFETLLHPWLSKEFPKFENWERKVLEPNEMPRFFEKQLDSPKSSCFSRKLIDMSNGKGIVITIFPNIRRVQQFNNIKRLIRVLRAVKNKLPIQIIYSGLDLNEKEKNDLINAARNENANLPKSFYESLNSIDDHPLEEDFPVQDLWFVDISSVINPSTSQFYSYKDPDFFLQLSSIFNSFEEVIMLTNQAIPLASEFEKIYFENKNYRENGALLFKNPSIYSTRPRKFKAGFHEVQNLIKNHFLPSEHDQLYFGLHRRDSTTRSSTSRVLDEYFQNLMDPNFFVIKKSKALSGLLISCNLKRYKIFSARFEHKTNEINSEFLWLGQEIAGINKKINFNRHFGVSAGVLTPVVNSLLTSSHELCSSSWGQLSDVDDYTLLYVTSSQLDNAIHDKSIFLNTLKEKYAVKYQDDIKEKIMNDNELDHLFESISKNPLYIDSVINPPVLSKPIYIDKSLEPHDAWIDQHMNLYSNSYWCAYDIVGSPDSMNRGVVISYGEKMRRRLNTLLNTWFLD